MRYLRSVFYLDLRSLALFRVGLALILLWDLTDRMRDLKAHYSDLGVLPRDTFLGLFAYPYEFSLHLFSGQWQMLALLFAIQMMIAVGLLVGFKTRWCTVLSWLLLTSLHYRNTILLYGGDTVLRVMLFWSMFLPLGACFSVDRALERQDRSAMPPTSLITVGSVAFILQLASIYVFTGLMKKHPMWFQDGEALYYALSAGALVRNFGLWLRNFPTFLEFATYATLLLEVVGPVGLLITWRRSIMRLPVALMFIVFHLGIAATMDVGFFSYICIVSWLALIPSWIWDTLKQRIATQQLILIYDGDCTFCEKIARILKVFLILPHAQIAPSDQNIAWQKTVEQKNSWIVKSSQQEDLFGFAALTYVISKSPLWSWTTPLLRLPLSQRIGQDIYRWVANHRQQLSALTKILKWRKLSWSLHPAAQGIVAFLAGYTLLWNIQSLQDSKERSIIPPSLYWIAEVTGLSQEWAMFAPYPGMENGWYVIPGRLANGKIIDLWSGEDVRYEPPFNIADTYKNDRWRKYMMSLWHAEFADYRYGFGGYLCHQWNSTHSNAQRLETFKIIFMLQTLQSHYRPTLPTERITIWEHDCRPAESQEISQNTN